MQAVFLYAFLRSAVVLLSGVEVDDLLGRDAAPPNHELLDANITGKVVMVSGAGGAIGSELCRQIIQLLPAMLVLYEYHEYALYAMEQELLEWASESGSALDGRTILPVLASVTDQKYLEQVSNELGVQDHLSRCGL
jgi:FlaA1/EpsC-like NDP-sugar epimerase